MAEWNVGVFEVPDVIGYQDYLLGARGLATDLSHDGDEYQPRPIATFPYPNPPKTTPRWLTIADAHDLVVLRAAAGVIITRTDLLLPSCVRSCRLDPSPSAAWHFKHSGSAHAALRRDAVAHLRRSFDSMCKSDVAGYYPSVNLGLLADALLRSKCNADAIALLLRVLGSWQAHHGLAGLPIGPEGCGVLGNAFLLPLDLAIARRKHTHLRWMDDLFIFGPSITDCNDIVGPLDEALGALGLKRSVQKTNTYGNRDAIDLIEDRLLTSLGDDMKRHKALATERLHDAFDYCIRSRDDVEPHRFRWIVNALKKRADPYGVVPLAESPPTMNTDPRCSGEYLRQVGIGRRRVVDGILSKLDQPAADITDGLDVRLLQAMSTKPRGRAEGHVFENIAEDRRRRPAVRGWAYQALRTTPLWTGARAMEAARAEPDAHVRRAIVVTLRGSQGSTFRKFLRHVEGQFPELKYTRRWCEAA